MTDPIRAALERLHQYAETFPEHDTDSIVARAQAALSAAAPAVQSREPAAARRPTDAELLELYPLSMTDLDDAFAFARAVLARFGAQR